MRCASLILALTLAAGPALAQGDPALPAPGGFNLEALRSAARVCQTHAVCPPGTVVTPGLEEIARQRCSKEPTAWDGQAFADSCPGILQQLRDFVARQDATPPPIPESGTADQQILEKVIK